MLQAVLDALEQPFYQQQTRGGQLTPQLAWGASQGLRCAATLRRLLHPGRLLPKQAEVWLSLCQSAGLDDVAA